MKSITFWIVCEGCGGEKLARSLAAAVVLLVAMFYAVPVGAQQSADDNLVDAPRSDTISGRVINVNGQPISDATVSVRQFDAKGQGSVTTTDSEGNFRVSGLEAKAYLVSASVPAYTAVPRDPTSSKPNYYRVGDTVKIEMLKGGVFTGTVTTAAGDPVVAVPVKAYMIRDGNGQPPRYGAQPRQRLTDDRGVYRIYGLPPGTYVVAAGGEGSQSSSHLSNAYETDTQTYAPSSARNTAREIVLRAGEETGNVDIRYIGEPGFTISGSVSDSRSPVEPTWISINLSSINSGGLQENLTTSQSFNAQKFTIHGIADGDYMLTAQSYSADEWAVSESRRIRVIGADITGIDLIARPFGAIAGRVVLEESKAPECKGKRRPVFEETVITPWHNNKESKNQPLFIWAFGEPSTPKNDGAFTLRNLASGQYRLHTRLFARYWYLRSITLPSLITAPAKTPSADRLQDVAKNWITVKLGDRLSGLVVTIAEGAASLHGQVIPPEGQKSASGLSVYLVPAESDRAEDVLRFFASTVSTDGRFALNNVAPGRYWVRASPSGEKELELQSKLRLPDQSAERVKLRQEAEAAKTAVELKPCQNITNFTLPITVP